MWQYFKNIIYAIIYRHRLSLVFDQPHDWYLLNELALACEQQAEKEGKETLTAPQQALLTIWQASGVIGNGGFRYFFECGLDANITIQAYEKAECPQKAEAVRKALSFFPNSRPSENIKDRLEQLEQIEQSGKEEFEELSPIIWSQSFESDAHLALWVRRHRKDFNGRYLPDHKPDGWFLEVPPPPPDASPREVAEWILAISGWIDIMLPREQESRFVSKMEDLPSEIESINRVILSSIRSATDRDIGHLARLRALDKLCRLDLSGTEVTKDGLAKLRHWPALEELDLSRTNLKSEDLAMLAPLTRLRNLKLPRTMDELNLRHLLPFQNLRRLEGIQFTDAGLFFLKSLRALEDISLIELQISDAGLEHLGHITNFKKLLLWRMPLTDAGFSHLRNLLNLEELNLDSLKIGDNSLELLGRFVHLKFLGLSCCPIGDRGLLHLKNLIALEDLRLSGTMISDGGLPGISEMSQLRHLTVGETLITGSGLKHLYKLTNLKELYIDGTKLSDEGAQCLRVFKGLECLWMNKNCITDNGLAGLSDLSKLTHLNISETHICGQGLSHLIALPALEDLNVWRTSVGNSELPYFRKMPSLRDLDLSETNIDDNGLKGLKTLKQLTNLRLRRTRLTAGALKELEVALPNCQIHTY